MIKRSKPLLVAAVLGTIYAIYLIGYFGSATIGAGDAMSALGAGIAAALVMPHMVCTALAVIFGWVGWACRARWAALAGGILYAVAIVLFLMYAPFVVVQMILCFVAFGRMKKAPQMETVKEEDAQ